MDAVSDWVSVPPSETDHGPGAVLVSALLHAAAFGLVLMLPPGTSLLSLDETHDPSSHDRVALVSLRSFVEQGAAASAGRDDRVPAAGLGVQSRAAASARTRTHAQADAPRASSSAWLAALAGRMQAITIDAPRFIAADALAGLDGATVAPPSSLGLDMVGAGRGSGAGRGDVVGLGTSLGIASSAPGLALTCTEGELDRRAAVMGRIAAIASCAAGPSANGMSGFGSGYGAGQGVPVPASHVGICHCGNAYTSGALSREAIRRVVRRHEAEIRGCYQSALGARPDLEGRVTTQFVIAPTGRVQSSNVDAERSDLRHAGVEQCIASAVARWTFPSASSPTVVSYPFVLGSSS